MFGRGARWPVVSSERPHTNSQLGTTEAREIVERRIAVIDEVWDEMAVTSEMIDVERREARGRQILSPYALEGM
jgi:hypothetical protein